MTRKTAFFEGWPWFKFNNLELALDTNLKFYSSLSKGLEEKVRKYWGLIPTFVEEENRRNRRKSGRGGPFWLRILNRGKDFFSKCDQIRSFLRICSYLLKKSLMKNFVFVQCQKSRGKERDSGMKWVITYLSSFNAATIR